jgi:hypothetical protein
LRRIDEHVEAPVDVPQHHVLTAEYHKAINLGVCSVSGVRVHERRHEYAEAGGRYQLASARLLLANQIEANLNFWTFLVKTIA